jgi:hypothetical protein
MVQAFLSRLSIETSYRAVISIPSSGLPCNLVLHVSPGAMGKARVRVPRRDDLARSKGRLVRVFSTKIHDLKLAHLIDRVTKAEIAGS